jgi:membrane protease subunit (stomatin/prohibitin family)
MPLRPLLLHVLLSLALVANGIGTAMASVHADCAHGTVAAALPVAEPPCHEEMGMGISKAQSAMSDVDLQHEDMDHNSLSQQASATDDEGCSDCADHCRCACIAHGLAALMPSTWLPQEAIGVACTTAPSFAHASPSLPYPVRPPIG